MPNMPTQPNRPNMPIMPKSTNSAHISLSVIDAFLRKVHAGFDTMSSVEQGIWREILTQINAATVEGLMQSSAPPTTRRSSLPSDTPTRSLLPSRCMPYSRRWPPNSSHPTAA